MRVFVAGGTGAIGRRLVPQLVARGHQVTATTTSAGKLGLLEQLGSEGIVMDGLDAASVGEAVAAARPDAIVHEMTALSVAHNGKPNFRHPERLAASTNRLRTEGTDHLLAVAEATGVSHVVAQSVATWTEIGDGGRVSSRDAGRGVRGAAATAVRDRLPDPRQRGRGRGRGPGDLAALRGLPDTTHVDQGLPLGRGDPGLNRRAALGTRLAGGLRRAVVPRAFAHRPPTRIRRGRQSWRIRYRWQPCCF